MILVKLADLDELLGDSRKEISAAKRRLRSCEDPVLLLATKSLVEQQKRITLQMKDFVSLQKNGSKHSTNKRYRLRFAEKHLKTRAKEHELEKRSEEGR